MCYVLGLGSEGKGVCRSPPPLMKGQTVGRKNFVNHVDVSINYVDVCTNYVDVYTNYDVVCRLSLPFPPSIYG